MADRLVCAVVAAFAAVLATNADDGAARLWHYASALERKYLLLTILLIFLNNDRYERNTGRYHYYYCSCF